MIPRKERIEMDRITIFDRFIWFWNDNWSWIMFGIVLGSLPFVPDYIEFVLNCFDW